MILINFNRGREDLWRFLLLDMPNALLALDYIYPHNIALLPQK